MMGGIGVPELVIILFVSLTSLVPIAIGVWLIVSVVRLRTNQKTLETRLEQLERGTRQF